MRSIKVYWCIILPRSNTFVYFQLTRSARTYFGIVNEIKSLFCLAFLKKLQMLLNYNVKFTVEDWSSNFYESGL